MKYPILQPCLHQCGKVSRIYYYRTMQQSQHQQIYQLLCHRTLLRQALSIGKRDSGPYLHRIHATACVHIALSRSARDRQNLMLFPNLVPRLLMLSSRFLRVILKAGREGLGTRLKISRYATLRSYNNNSLPTVLYNKRMRKRNRIAVYPLHWEQSS